MKKKSNNTSNDILSILFDENNTDPLVLYNDDVKYTFHQIAVIPYNSEIYSILKPVEMIEGIADDEAIVFKVLEDENGDSYLIVEEDENKAKLVFDEYLKLYNEKHNNEED